MSETKECCNTCIHKLMLEQWDYSKIRTDGKWKKLQKGFVCDAFADEGVAVWMLGLDGEGQCECWESKDD